MAWRGEELIVSTIENAAHQGLTMLRLRLRAFDRNWRSRVIAERIPVHSNFLTGPFAISADTLRAYWLYKWPLVTDHRIYV